MKRQVVAGIADSETKWKRFSYSVGVFVTGFLVAFFAASLVAKPGDAVADDTDTTTVTASGYSLTLTATSEVNLGLQVSDNDSMTVGLGNISVTTNSPGYNLYIGMSGDTTALNGIADGISGSIAAVNGSVTAPAALTRGTWGYAIPRNTAHVVSNAFATTYTPMSSGTPDSGQTFAVPPISSTNPQLIATSNAAATSGDNYPIYYGVRANSATAPGEYSNKVLFTATADAGASRALTLTPSTIDANTATTVTVATTLYSTADYLEATVTLGNTALTCTRTSNAPLSFSCAIPATTDGSYTITVSVPRYSETYTGTLVVDDPTNYMQDFTIAECNAMSTGDAITLRDSRDDNDYVIKKLADGKCWMTQNLRLQNKSISNADSNLPSGKTVVIPASSTANWCTTNSSACNEQLMTLDATDTSIPGQENAQSSYGVYYNWYTATATYGTTFSMTSGSVSYDICPKGWRLPTGYFGEFYTLYNSYGSSALMQGVPGFVPSGYRRGSSTSGQGSYGYYWSSTANSDIYAYYLSLSSPREISSKYNGYSVRCIQDTRTLADITYMQEMTPTIVANTLVGTSKTLTDKRDNNTYTVRKHEDGNIWMTSNLRLGKANTAITLTSVDSDVASDFTIESTAIQTSGSTSWGDASNSGNAKHVYPTGNTTYGNYYNWYTATAGTGLGTMSSASATNLTNATSSICPKGWRLPDGGQSPTVSFFALDKALGGNGNIRTDASQRDKFISSPYNFPYSGGYNYWGAVALQGSRGYWWSRSAATQAGQAYYFYLTTGNFVAPQGYNYVGYGYAVRCVAE